MQWTGVLYSFWCHYSVVFCHWYQISIPQCCGASECFFATHILTHQIDRSAFLIRQVALHAHTMKVFTAFSAANDPNKVQVSTLCVFTTNQYWQCAIWFHSCWCALRFAANLRHISEKEQRVSVQCCVSVSLQCSGLSSRQRSMERYEYVPFHMLCTYLSSV